MERRERERESEVSEKIELMCVVCVQMKTAVEDAVSTAEKAVVREYIVLPLTHSHFFHTSISLSLSSLNASPPPFPFRPSVCVCVRVCVVQRSLRRKLVFVLQRLLEKRRLRDEEEADLHQNFKLLYGVWRQIR